MHTINKRIRIQYIGKMHNVTAIGCVCVCVSFCLQMHNSLKLFFCFFFFSIYIHIWHAHAYVCMQVFTTTNGLTYRKTERKGWIKFGHKMLFIDFVSMYCGCLSASVCVCSICISHSHFSGVSDEHTTGWIYMQPEGTIVGRLRHTHMHVILRMDISTHDNGLSIFISLGTLHKIAYDKNAAEVQKQFFWRAQ